MKSKKPDKGLPFFGIGKILPYIKNFKKIIFLMVLLGLCSSLTEVALPVFQKYALDHFIADRTMDTAAIFVTLFLFTVFLGGVCQFLSSTLAMKIEFDVDRDLRNAAFTHLQTLSLSFFNQNSVGYIHARVMSDTSRIGELAAWGIMDTLWRIAYLVGALAVMFSINIKLALLVILVLPAASALFSFFQKKLIVVHREVREINSKITGDFSEGITGVKTIKSLVIEKKAARSFYGDTSAIKAKTVRYAHIRGLFDGAMDFVSSLALALILWKGGAIISSEVGTFSLFMFYAQGLTETVRWLIDGFSDIITTQVNIERFSRLMETKSEVEDTPEVIEKYGGAFDPKKENWEDLKGDVEFEDVTFKYPDGEEYVLEHFNLKIPFGTNLAIVGETGAGKSTLVNLVCRFFEPTSGRVLIDGRDVKERSLLWLHSFLGYVLQTPHLFSGTIRDNLLYGKNDATDEEIYRALDVVSASDIVSRLENGLDTDVGEGGNLLSAGEKQLISFARAVLSDPKILILDEATSSVDTITEQKILAAMKAVIKGRTSIVIAHRLSTIRNADLIMVVKDGKIIEHGNHEKLMRDRGYYHSLYTKQFEDEAVSSLLA